MPLVSGVIDKMVAMMILQNKVSPASSYDVRSAVSERPVEFVLSDLLILAFCVLIKRRSWFAFDPAISTSFLSVLQQYSASSTLYSDGEES